MNIQNQYDLAQTVSSLLTVQTKRLKSLMLILFVLFSVMAVGLYFIPAKSSDDQLIKLGIVGFFVVMDIFILLLITFELKKYHPEQSKILEAIQNRNSDQFFVWIYPHKLVRNHVATYSIILGSDKKSRYRLVVSKEEDFVLINSFQNAISNVTYGYSDANNRQFRKDPKGLLRGSR